VLQLNNIHCTVAGHTVLQLDDLHVEHGDIFGVVGTNGAGKSTLVHTIAGDVPSQGEIHFHNIPIQHWKRPQLARNLGILAQSADTTFPFTAQEVVAMGGFPLRCRRTVRQQRIQAVMARTACSDVAKRAYPTLSGGEQQRVQLARVLLQLSEADYPPLLILDEPTSAQDWGQQQYVLELLHTLKAEQDFTILIVLHDLNQVLSHCNQCVIIHAGAKVAHGMPDAILTPETVKHYWQYRPEVLTRNNGQTVLI
jgi:iron complex transport system ATP-binding protein